MPACLECSGMEYTVHLLVQTIYSMIYDFDGVYKVVYLCCIM